jgi:hypothetical protein
MRLCPSAAAPIVVGTRGGDAYLVSTEGARDPKRDLSPSPRDRRNGRASRQSSGFASPSGFVSVQSY